MPPSNFEDEFRPVTFTDDELKDYQQILLNPAFQKALIIVNNMRPPCSLGDGVPAQEESRRLNQIRGWELYHAALLKIGMPKEEAKEYKPLKENWQNPDHNIIKPEQKNKPE